VSVSDDGAECRSLVVIGAVEMLLAELLLQLTDAL